MRKNPFSVRKLGVMISFELFVGIDSPRALKFKFPSTARGSNFHHSSLRTYEQARNVSSTSKFHFSRRAFDYCL